MKHLKKFEATLQSAEGSGQVPEVPTKSEVLGKIKDILNESGELGGLEVTEVVSKKGSASIKYLQILDRDERSIGIYISEIDPTISNSQEPYKGI